jgi:hypothetical protein
MSRAAPPPPKCQPSPPSSLTQPPTPWRRRNGFFFNNQPTSHPWFFSFTFCLTCMTIVSGCLAERTKLVVYPIYTIIICSFVHPLAVHWTWHSDGWLQTISKCHFLDFAGGTVVHLIGGHAFQCLLCPVLDDARQSTMPGGGGGAGGRSDGLPQGRAQATAAARRLRQAAQLVPPPDPLLPCCAGGFVGLVGAALCGPRMGRFEEGMVKDMQPHDMVFVSLGTFMLWFGW